MEISVELTLTPLQENYEHNIKHFIKKLRACNLQIIENPLSTQVYGEYNTVMQLLTTEIKDVFSLIDNGMIFMKIVKSNRYHYEPTF